MKHPVPPLAALALAAVLLALPAPGSAQSKTAVVNLREVLVKCAAGARIISDIQNGFAERRGRLAALEQETRRLAEEVKVLGADSPKARELQTVNAKYLEADRKFRLELAQEETARFKPLTEAIQAVIARYAKENGLTSVQDRAQFLYVDGSLDITAAIIRRVDQAK